MAKNKPHTLAHPWEIWQSADGEWEWRVLKKKSDLIWECAVKSPNTFGSWEYGDVYAETVTANNCTYIDRGFSPNYFADLIPVTIGTEIKVPNPDQPQTPLHPETFPFLCQYFAEDSMSFHCPDEQGRLLFFFNPPWEACHKVLEVNWGIEYSGQGPQHFGFDLLIYDEPEDPLTIPFVFNTTDERHRYEMSQIVEQETLPFFILARQNQSLFYYDSRFITLPEELLLDLGPAIRESLLKVAVAPDTPVVEGQG